MIGDTQAARHGTLEAVWLQLKEVAVQPALRALAPDN
jgi:hypothetical protein